MDGDVLLVALIAILVGALLKSISGIGLPLVTIPAVAAVADVETAVAFTALPNLAQNLALAWGERTARPLTRDLPVLGTTGVVGAVAGTLVLVSAPEEPLIVVLVAVVLAYVVVFLARPDFSVPAVRSRTWAPLVGTAAGALQGSVGISGPVVASWIHSYRLDQRAYILSVTVLFALAGAAQFVVLAGGGKLTGLWMATTIACVPALSTVPIGGRLRSRLSADRFDRVVIGVLAVSVVALAVQRLS